MSFLQKQFPILRTECLAKDIHELTVDCPELVCQAVPGQFVNIRTSHTLRRPISICNFDKEKGTLRLVVKAQGKGSDEICRMRPGDTIDLLGPLGNGFDVTDPTRKAVVVGGGIGAAPMLGTAAAYGANCTAILGFRDSADVILEKDFAALGCKVLLCTDNGTRGFHGFTTQMLENYLKENHVDIIHTCGPKPMMKGVKEIAAKYGVRCQISMDERMACGIGACLGCACKTKKEDGSSTYSHVCKHGPVFEAEQLDFE